MGAFLLAAEPSALLFIADHDPPAAWWHQPSPSQRHEIEAREILRMKEMLNRSLSEMSGQSRQIEKTPTGTIS